MSNVPPDLIIDILSYLPVKSLCRFRCVSKYWFALIIHPQFIKMHLARPRKQQLLLYNTYLSFLDLEISLKPKSCKKNKVHPKLDRLNKKPYTQGLDIIYSGNGLFYIKSAHEDSFFIYNPSTRESKKIRDVIFIDTLFNKIFYSFGYVESIDDYKVVRVLTKNIMHIFSLRNNSWKIVEGNFPFEQPNIRGGVSLNGALHWGTVSYPNDLGVITRFFKTLPLPDIPNPPQRCECMVRVVGEYLCVAFGTYNEFSGIKAEEGFWIMKEYGVKESWIRIVISHDPFDLYVPLCFWENDRIIISSDFGKRVFCYEKDGKNRKELLFEREYHVFTYEETLVSPNYNIGFTQNSAPSQLQSLTHFQGHLRMNQNQPSHPSWSSDAVQLALDIQGERQNSSVNLNFSRSAI